jgi:RNA polymerase sigma-70 factor (ECF subfamily)
MMSPDAIAAAGRQAYPEIDIAEADLTAQVAQTFPDGMPELSHAADIYLAWACALGHPAALRRLEHEYLSRVGAFIARIDTSPSATDEVRQLLRERLLVGDGRPRILDYQGRGPLGGWIRIASVRLAIDRQRQHRGRHEQPVDELIDEVARDPDPELALLRARYRTEFEAAMRVGLSALTARDRRLLHMSAIDGMNIDQIASIYRVHRATCARWLVAIRQRLVDATYRELEVKLDATRSEVASLRAAVASQLELSLSALLTSA